MSRKMIIDIDGKDYTLSLDRKEIVRGEKIGLNLSQLESSPLTQMSIFWNVGLHKEQPNLSTIKLEELMDKFIEEGGDIKEVIGFLSEEYATFFQTNLQNTKTLKKARLVEE